MPPAPPSPGPYPTSLQNYSAFELDHVLYVSLTTTLACHFQLARRFAPFVRHPKKRTLRGVAKICGIQYQRDAPHYYEQIEAGDTFIHTWEIPWPEQYDCIYWFWRMTSVIGFYTKWDSPPLQLCRAGRENLFETYSSGPAVTVGVGPGGWHGLGFWKLIRINNQPITGQPFVSSPITPPGPGRYAVQTNLRLRYSHEATVAILAVGDQFGGPNEVVACAGIPAYGLGNGSSPSIHVGFEGNFSSDAANGNVPYFFLGTHGTVSSQWGDLSINSDFDCWRFSSKVPTIIPGTIEHPTDAICP